MALRTVASLVFVALSAFAQDGSAIKTGFLTNFDDVSKKILSLAEAVPPGKYEWKPADGVRTIGQVYVHMIGANFMIPSALGVKPPEDVKLSRDMEKTMTAKTEIIPLLKKSLDHARSAISTSLDTPDKSVKLFGQSMTNSAAALLILTHLHEHLGQSIAYARSVGVTPPWSAGGAAGLQ